VAAFRSGAATRRRTGPQFESGFLERRVHVSQMVKNGEGGGRMIVTTRVRESYRGRLVTPLDAAAGWKGHGGEEEAA